MKLCWKLLAVVLCVSAQMQAWAATVQNMRTSSGNTRVRLVLDLDGPVKYVDRSQTKTVTLDIDGGVLQPKNITLGDRVLQSVQLTKNGRDKSRLTVALNRPAQYRVLLLKNPNRLVLDIYRIAIVKQHRELGGGLAYNYWQDDMEGLPVRLYFLEIKPGSAYQLRPFSGAVSENGRGRLQRASAAVGAKAAVNACYFDTDGWVIGNCRSGSQWYGIDPDEARSALVLDKAGRPSVLKDLRYSGLITLPRGKTVAVTGLNRERIAGDLVIYNGNYGSSTGTNAFGREVKLVDGRVTEVSTKGNMGLEGNCLVLSGHGDKAAALAGLRRGDRVTLTQTLGSQAADQAEVVVGGGPSLLTAGQVDVRSSQENMAGDIAWGRAPRTSVGIKADGSLIILVADGRASSSAGLSLNELAKYLRRLGAVQAVNFDGGGSSEMVLDGKVLNDPSDGEERPVSIGLGVFPK